MNVMMYEEGKSWITLDNSSFGLGKPTEWVVVVVPFTKRGNMLEAGLGV